MNKYLQKFIYRYMLLPTDVSHTLNSLKTVRSLESSFTAEKPSRLMKSEKKRTPPKTYQPALPWVRTAGKPHEMHSV